MRVEMKKRIIIICLALMLIISSFIIPSKKGVKAGAASAVDDGGDGMNITCRATDDDDDNTFTLAYSDGQMTLSCTSGGMNISKVTSIKMMAGTTLEIADSVSIGKLEFESDDSDIASAIINSGCTLTLGSFASGSNAGGDTVINNGTLVMDSFTLSDISRKNIDFTNNGTISAATISLDKPDASFTSSAGAVYRVSSRFVNREDYLSGTVVATSADTVIESYGGSFTLSYNGIEREITDKVNSTAGELCKKEFEITISDMDGIYQGVDFDPSKYVTLSDSGYDGTLKYRYQYNGSGEYRAEKPSSYGYYVMQVTAPETDTYFGTEAVRSFQIELLPLPENPLTMSGVENEVYVKDSVVLTPPSGFKVNSSIGDGEFTDKVVFDEEYIEYQKKEYGGFSQDDFFWLKRTKDGAETDSETFYNLFGELLNNLIFDPVEPTIATPVVDGKEQEISSGDDITAEKVEITISDVYLDKVVTSDKTYTPDSSTVSDEMGNAEKTVVVTFEAVEGSPKNCSLTATDLAGNEYKLSFKLTHPNDKKEKPTEDPTEAPTEDPTENPTEAPTENPTEAPAEPKLDPELTVSIEDQYYGVNYSPSITTDSDNYENVYYQYKVKGTPDTAYDFAKPVEVGNYVVRATVPASDNFNAVSKEAEYSIAYLDEPEDPYTISGIKGKNDYYISDVQLYAKPGFGIAKWINGSYNTSVNYIEGMTTVCLMRESDGAKTSLIRITDEIKIDKDKPELYGFARNQANQVVDLSKKIYADTLTFSIYDEHLAYVTLDGDDVEISDNTAKIELDSDGGRKTFSIVATDEAGNTYEQSVEVMAAWMESNIIPEGKKVRLEAGQSYKLGPGKWKISGDGTIYNGDTGVFVTADGTYTFTKLD